MIEQSRTMPAVCINESDGSLVVKIVPVPRPGKGEVLIKMLAAPINPSDLARIKHLTGSDERKSFIAGIEGSGTVVGHGEGILPRIWMGKRVACSSSHSNSGTWAQYMVTSAMTCIPLPKDISDEQGSMMIVNPLTAVAFFSMIKKERHKAVISTAAASALGGIIELLGKKLHVPVINIVRSEKQNTLLKLRGAQYVLNSSSENFENELQSLASQLKATLALDAIGGSITERLIRAVPFGSTVIIYGNLSGEQPQMDHRSLVTDNKTVRGFYLPNWLRQQGMLATVRSILKARTLLKSDINLPVQARFPLREVNQAAGCYLENMTAGKVLLIPGH